MISFVFHAQLLLLVVAVAPGSILSISLEGGESLVSKYLDSILVKKKKRFFDGQIPSLSIKKTFHL
jgi:hypothetical protein